MIRAVCLAIVLLLASNVSASAQVEGANPVGPKHFSNGVNVFCPVNATYNFSPLIFNYTFLVGPGLSNSILTYDIDGKYNGTMPYTIINPQELHVAYLSVGQVRLPMLSEGTHWLTVSLHVNPKTKIFYINSYSDTVYFTINSSAPSFVWDETPPTIELQSPKKNQTYPANNVPLVFYSDEPTSQMTLYIDNQKTILAAQNTTLDGLSLGGHQLTLQVTDLAGNTAYGLSAYFNVSEPISTPTPTPPPVTQLAPLKTAEPPLATELVILLVLAICIAIAGLMVLRKTRANRRCQLLKFVIFQLYTSWSIAKPRNLRR